MIDFTLLRANRNSKGQVVTSVEVAGLEQTWTYTDIRSAFVLSPTPYYLILGELAPDKYDDKRVQRNPYYLLDEFESGNLSLNDFFSRLTDSLTLLCCNDIYCADPWVRGKDEADLFYAYRDTMGGLTNLRLIGAPFSDNFRIGISQLMDTINGGLVQIPKTSLVWENLETFRKKDAFREPSPEKTFYRLRCLAFGICGFLKFRPGPALDMEALKRAMEGKMM